MQSDVSVSHGSITGTLKYLGTDNAITNVWGYGNFLCVKFTCDDWSDYDSVLCGLVPSASGMDLSDIKNDDTHNAVMKISDKNTQVLKVVYVQDGIEQTDIYSLAGLTVQGSGA